MNNLEFGAGGVFGKVYLDQVSMPNVMEPITFAFTRAALRGTWPVTSCVDPGIRVTVQGLLGLNTDIIGPLTQYKLGRLGENRFSPANQGWHASCAGSATTRFREIPVAGRR